MSATAYRKLKDNLAQSIITIVGEIKGDGCLDSNAVSENIIKSYNLGSKLTDKERVEFANDVSKRMSALSRPGVDKIFRPDERVGKLFVYRAFKKGDKNKPAQAKKPAAKVASKAAAKVPAKTQQKQTVASKVKSNLVKSIEMLSLLNPDELGKAMAAALIRMTELRADTTDALTDTQKQLKEREGELAKANNTLGKFREVASSLS